MSHTGNGISLINLPVNADDAKKAVASVNGLFAEIKKISGNMVVLRCSTALKSDLPVWGQSGADLTVMKRIKSEVDPKGLMNPGRFVV